MAIPNTFASQTGNITLSSLDENFTYLENGKLTSSGGTVSGDLTINGDLTVQGTTTTIEAANLSVADNMIYLNDGSSNTNVDLGIAGNYNDGTYAHTGLFRDADDGYWKFYDSYTPEPDAAVDIDTAHASFSIAPIQASTVKLNNWTVTEASDILYFAHNGTNKMKLDSSGNLTVVGDITAFGTI